MSDDQQRASGPAGPAIPARLVAPTRGLGLALLSVPQVALFSVTVTAIGLLGAGVGLWLVPPAVLALRASANLSRRLARDYSGIEIAEPYRPRPPARGGVAGLARTCRWLLADPATWRDLLWSLANAPVGMFLALLPAAFVIEGLWGIVLPFLWPTIGGAVDGVWFTFLPVNGQSRAWLALALGLVYIAVGLRIGPAMLAAHARWTRSLLAPTAGADLRLRVTQLAESRSETVDAGAAELRRIERDLHDGAQARLVAMGMNLGAAEQLLDSDPDAARALLAEMRVASSKALDELRDLVRGIHPPVLADRGLPDALRALALDTPLDVTVSANLPGRAEPPVESAVYFAVSELLTNALRHGEAAAGTVDLRYLTSGQAAGTLRVTVMDDGRGGADASRGTGLRGIERRLGAFDGTLALRSPPGGPTTATLEVPCALSSPKTSSS